MARPPKSVEAHKLDGTYRNDRHGDRGTQLEKITAIKCPETLKGKTAKLWNDVVPELCRAGLVTAVDAPVLEHAFYCYQAAIDLRKVIEKSGGPAAYIAALSKRSKDCLYESLRYMQEYEKIMYKFGVTPVESAKVRTNKSSNELETDAITRLIGNG